MRKHVFLYYTPGVVLVGIGAVSALFPEHRLWGGNHLGFLSPFGRTVALVLMAAGMFPPISRALFEVLARAARWCSGHPSWTRVFLVLGVSVGLVMFLAFSSSTLLLGDGTYMASTLKTVAEQDSKGLGYYLRQVPTTERVYPGTGALYMLVSVIAQQIGMSYLDGVKVMVAVLGAAFLLIPLGFLRQSRTPFPGRLLVAGVILTSGVLELFFGYIEVYAPMILLAAMFCVSGFGVVSARRSIWWPTLCFVVGVVAHLQMLLLLPALLFLVLYRAVGEGKALKVAAVTIAVGCLAGSLGISRFDEIQHLVLSLSGSDSAYAMLSTAHVVDVVNEVMLVVPATPLVVVLLLFLWRNAGASTRGRWNSLLGAIQPDVLFAVMLAIPVGMFLMLFRPELGMARDWDLFSICGLPIVAIAHVAVRRVPQHCWDDFTKLAVLPTLVASAMLTSSWIMVNANEAMSVARYASILHYDTTNGAYAYENLSAYYHDGGDVAGEIRALERAVEFSPNPRYLFKIGLRYFSFGDRERGVAWLRRCLLARPEHGKTRQFLAQMLYFSGKHEETVAVCLEGERLAPDNPFYPFSLGQAYTALGRGEEAGAAFSRCLELNPSEEMIGAIQEILQ